jgi:hypothetical protein
MDRMPAQWSKAVQRWERWRSRGRLKPEFEQLTYDMLERLRPITSTEELLKKYYLGNYWALQLARRKHPDREELWDMGMTADVAYAKRYQELTGEPAPDDLDDDEGDGE